MLGANLGTRQGQSTGVADAAFDPAPLDEGEVTELSRVPLPEAGELGLAGEQVRLWRRREAEVRGEEVLGRNVEAEPAVGPRDRLLAAAGGARRAPPARDHAQDAADLDARHWASAGVDDATRDRGRVDRSRGVGRIGELARPNRGVAPGGLGADAAARRRWTCPAGIARALLARVPLRRRGGLGSGAG